jgi:hypothetical protein
MVSVYVVLYIHTGVPEFSEILGVFKDKESAVAELLERANYRENKEGVLTQYMHPTNEYESFAILRAKVMEEMELHDKDIYRITECPCV